MATEEHKALASIIKKCHDELRINCKHMGAAQAWQEHLRNTQARKMYANAMQRLAKIWEYNTTKEDQMAKSRIQWTINFCDSYFFTQKLLLQKRAKEERILESLPDYQKSLCQYINMYDEVIRVLDVGSCFNAFAQCSQFDVTAIDLCPAVDTGVLKGDFLQVTLDNSMYVDKNDNELTQLPRGYYECVIFSLLLEYIPSSEQRIECCRKGFELLTAEGILVIITPDSQHVGKNAVLMKNWRYTLALLGFSRIHFEKLPHITCMVFRKPIDGRLCARWAQLHKEDYMNFSIEIPQDKLF